MTRLRDSNGERGEVAMIESRDQWEKFGRNQNQSRNCRRRSGREEGRGGGSLGMSIMYRNDGCKIEIRVDHLDFRDGGWSNDGEYSKDILRYKYWDSG